MARRSITRMSLLPLALTPDQTLSRMVMLLRSGGWLVQRRAQKGPLDEEGPRLRAFFVRGARPRLIDRSAGRVAHLVEGQPVADLVAAEQVEEPAPPPH